MKGNLQLTGTKKKIKNKTKTIFYFILKLHKLSGWYWIHDLAFHRDLSRGGGATWARPNVMLLILISQHPKHPQQFNKFCFVHVTVPEIPSHATVCLDNPGQETQPPFLTQLASKSHYMILLSSKVMHDSWGKELNHYTTLISTILYHSFVWLNVSIAQTNHWNMNYNPSMKH